MKNKKNLIIAIILLLSIGTTLAFFTSTSTLENEFKSGKYKTVSTDNFTSPSDWKPGDTTPKTITTKNEGTLPVRVRVKLEEEWKSENGDELYLDYDNEPVSIINLDNEEDWVKDGNYFYYIDILNPGESTSSLIKSVTYNPNIPSDMDCTSTNGVYNCKSTGDGYDGGTYTLNITVETVQSDAVLTAWNLLYEPTEERTIYTLGYEIDYGTYEETNSNIFVRKTMLGEMANKIEIGFILNDNVYYLKGESQIFYNTINHGQSSYYNENKSTLISAFGNANCEENILNDGKNTKQFSCNGGGFMAIIDDYGQIHVGESVGSFGCRATDACNGFCDNGYD